MREAFRHDLKGIGADPSKCGPPFLRSVERLFRLTVVSATRSLMKLMTIWIEDFLLSNSLGVKPCKLLVSISPLPNTLSLYIGAVLARPTQNNLFGSAMLCCHLLWSGDKICYF